jgi:hypothetical protein
MQSLVPLYIAGELSTLTYTGLHCCTVCSNALAMASLSLYRHLTSSIAAVGAAAKGIGTQLPSAP